MSQPQEQKKQKLPQYTTLADLVKSKDARAVMKKRLPYKSWTLYIFKNPGRFTIKITAYRNKKIYTKLSVDLNDIKYLYELLTEIETTFKSLGIKPSQV